MHLSPLEKSGPDVVADPSLPCLTCVRLGRSEVAEEEHCEDCAAHLQTLLWGGLCDGCADLAQLALEAQEEPDSDADVSVDALT